jgi:hypothetical protein
MKTAEEFLIEKEYPLYNESGGLGMYYVREAMIEFAKMHVLKIKHLQQSKYYSGETGYIKSEEWENIINNIK